MARQSSMSPIVSGRPSVVPPSRDVNPADPVAYVLSLNLHRRHLTSSQRAMVAERVREIYDRQAKERQKVRKGKQPGATPEKLPELNKGDARDQAGKALGVSGKLVDAASKVREEGVPELAKAVETTPPDRSAGRKIVLVKRARRSTVGL